MVNITKNYLLQMEILLAKVLENASLSRKEMAQAIRTRFPAEVPYKMNFDAALTGNHRFTSNDEGKWSYISGNFLIKTRIA